MASDLLTRESPFLAGYDRLRETLTHLGPEWVEGLREENRERFARTGLPGNDDEAWRFTRLKSLAKTAFRFAGDTAPALDRMPSPVSGEAPCQRLVFVNGVFVPEYSHTVREGCPEALPLGGKLVRTDLDVHLAGDGAQTSLNGLYFTRGGEHVDHHLRVDHAAAHTASRQLYKGVLDGKSTAVFNGRVVIRPDAQKVDAGQVNRNLLLSKEAVVNTNPELEIFADDVKAQHGATVGQIEDEPLFYLQSRGIPEAEARTLLIEAFAGEMVERFSTASVRDFLREELLRRFEPSEGHATREALP